MYVSGNPQGRKMKNMNGTKIEAAPTKAVRRVIFRASVSVYVCLTSLSFSCPRVFFGMLFWHACRWVL